MPESGVSQVSTRRFLWEDFYSPVVDSVAEQSENTLGLAEELIRKLDEESHKMLDHISRKKRRRTRRGRGMRGGRREKWGALPWRVMN